MPAWGSPTCRVRRAARDSTWLHDRATSLRSLDGWRSAGVGKGRRHANMTGFCLVGAGFIGPIHAANVASHARARLRWIVDLNLAAAQGLASKHGARATSDLAEALADREVHAVIICTPPRTHVTVIEAAARAG